MVRLTRQGILFEFRTAEKKIFEALKATVTEEPILRKWCPELPTQVETNALDGITGGVLSQR